MRPPRGVNFKRVAKEVEEHLFEPPWIAVDAQRRHGGISSSSPLAATDGMMLSTMPRSSSCRSISSMSRVMRPDFSRREIEQLLDQLGLPRRVVVNRLQRAGRCRGVERAVLQHRRPADHGIERRAQLV